MPRSDRTATSIAPDEPDRAGAHDGGDHHRPLDHDSAGDHDDAIRTAVAVRGAVHSGSAAAFGAGGAETCERGCNQCSCEKNLHVVSLPKAAKRHLMKSINQSTG